MSFTTQSASEYCVQNTIPYYHDFKNADDNVCWTVVDANGDGNTFRFDTASGYACYRTNSYYFTPVPADEYLISPTYHYGGNPTVLHYKNHDLTSLINAIYEVLAFGPDTVLIVSPDTFNTDSWITHRLDISNLNGDYAIAFHCISEITWDETTTAFSDFRVYEPSLPSVTTLYVTLPTDTSVQCGGKWTDDGGADTEFGFCWSTSPNPTLSDNHTPTSVEQYNIHYFYDTLTGLSPGTQYYLRAYATNMLGTVYGEQLTFTTSSETLNGLPCPGTPTVTDVDNNTYYTVKLGNQCWMKENLRTTHYADNTPIELGGNNVSQTTAYRYYPNNNSENVSTYGYLYNMAAVRNGAPSSTSIPSGVQGICPTGWHVPSREEWTELRMFVLNHSQEYVCYDGTSQWAFNNSKALVSTTGWAVNYDPQGVSSCSPIVNPSTNNATNFSAFPAGIRYGNNMFTFPYQEVGWMTEFWSCTQETNINGATITIDGMSTEVLNGGTDMKTGCSVRCIRD